MQFKKFLSEMTMSAGELEFPEIDFSKAEHIGDIGGNKILYFTYDNKKAYGLSVEDKIQCYLISFDVNILNNNYEEISILNTRKESRGKNCAKELIFFLKSWLHKSFIFGNIMSKDGQRFVQSLSKTGRFRIKWLNIKTGEEHVYDWQTDDFNKKPYRSIEFPTDWQLVMEGLKINEDIQIPFFEKDYWKKFGGNVKIKFFS